MPSLRCVYCSRPFEYAPEARGEFPFCSRRCRLLDLGRWLDGEYFLSSPLSEEEAALHATRKGDSGEDEACPSTPRDC